MKYRELLKALLTLSDDELDMDITVAAKGDDEFFQGIDFVRVCDGLEEAAEDVLEEGQMVIIFGEPS